MVHSRYMSDTGVTGVTGDRGEAGEAVAPGGVRGGGDRPPRRRRPVLTTVAAVLCGLGVVAAYLMFGDRRPAGPASTLRAFPLHLLPLTLAAAVVLGLALRRGRRRAAVLAGLSALLTATTALVPTIQLARAAHEMGATVSLADYLRHAFTPNSGEPAPDRSVTYAEVDGHALELDVWPADEAPGRRPAVVLMHGGGWRHSSRGATPEWNRWLNEQGYHVFDVDYRLIGDVPEGTAWRKTVQDTKCAVAWVAAHAARYGVDPARISVMGRSAGGQLSMMTAYTGGDPRFRPSCALPMPEVRSVVELYGRADLTLFEGGDNGMAHRNLEQLIGGSPDDYPQRYTAASPVNHVTPEAPPTLLLAGESDHLVPAAQARALAEALRVNGVPHEARYFPYTDHGYDNNWGGLATQASRAEIRDFLARFG
jgi:acetyl esterase/lipase